MMSEKNPSQAKKYTALSFNKELFGKEKKRMPNLIKLIPAAILLIVGLSTLVYFSMTDVPLRVLFILAGAVIAVLSLPLLISSFKRRRRRVADVTGMINYIDTLSGAEFEVFCAKLLEKAGFTDIEINGSSGDQGADIIAKKGDVRYAVQCKHRLDPYKTKYGNKPIQEVHASLSFYCCDCGFVITNGYFTKGGIDAAAVTSVMLWDRDRLISLLAEL